MRAPRKTKARQAEDRTQAEDMPQDEIAATGLCPRCLGNKRVMEFHSGDHAAGHLAGWKADLCPICNGSGSISSASRVSNVKEETAATGAASRAATLDQLDPTLDQENLA